MLSVPWQLLSRVSLLVLRLALAYPLAAFGRKRGSCKCHPQHQGFRGRGEWGPWKWRLDPVPEGSDVRESASPAPSSSLIRWLQFNPSSSASAGGWTWGGEPGEALPTPGGGTYGRGLFGGQGPVPTTEECELSKSEGRGKSGLWMAGKRVVISHLVARDREPSLSLFNSAPPRFCSEGLTWLGALRCREPRRKLLRVLLSPVVMSRGWSLKKTEALTWLQGDILSVRTREFF